MIRKPSYYVSGGRKLVKKKELKMRQEVLERFAAYINSVLYEKEDKEQL